MNYKNKDNSSDSEEFQKAEPVKKGAGLGAPPAPSRVAAVKPVTAAPDLLSFDTSGPAAANGGLTNDMFASKPDDGFGDFAQSTPAANSNLNMGGQGPSNVN